MKNWYEIKNVHRLDSPALVVHPARVKHNIDQAIKMVGDVKRLRPHVKTFKSAEPVKMMMDAGITRFKCATIAEAEMLAMQSAPDVLLAYQPLGPKLTRFIELVKKYPSTKFSCLTDHRSAADEQSNAFKKNDVNIPVFIDVNVGMNRTGIEPGDAVELYDHCRKVGLRVQGIHAYDGHVRDKDLVLRKKHCDEAFARVEDLKGKYPDLTIVAGGSPSFAIHAQRKEVECSPGTFVYWDKSYLDLCPDQEFLPAAVLVTRIISLPAIGKICLDLGHKSIAPENEINRRAFFLNANNLEPLGQSEEHLVMATEGDHHIGDILYALPYHICPTVALYECVYIIEDGNVTGEWKNLARDRKLTV